MCRGTCSVSVDAIDLSIHDVKLVVKLDVLVDGVVGDFLKVITEDFLAELVRKVKYEVTESGIEACRSHGDVV